MSSAEHDPPIDSVEVSVDAYLARPAIQLDVESALLRLNGPARLEWRAQVEIEPGRMRFPRWIPGESIPLGTLRLHCIANVPGARESPG